MAKVLDIKDLYVSFDTYAGEVQAVRGVSYSVDEGQVLAVVGESGCGKSVTAQTIMKLNPMPPARIKYGTLTLGDIDIINTPEEDMQKIRGKEVSMIFQDPMTCLNPTMKVGKQIVEAIVHHQHLSKEEAQKKAIEMLKLVQIPNAEERANQYPHQFSGGQRQRIGIARALALNPKFIVCDEAVSALDVSIQSQVLNLLQDLKEEQNLTYMFISHDLSVVKYISDRIGVMYLGKIVELGDYRTIFGDSRHPYTKALLSAIPIPKIGVERKQIILKGDVPSPVNLPGGCRFAGRCPYATDKCRQEEPKLKDVGNTHYVACHYDNLE